MENILEKNNLAKPPKVGELVEGKIIESKRGALYVDLGAVGTGIIFGKEFYDSKSALKSLKPGDNIFVKVIDLENEDGYIELSLSQAGQEMTWDGLRQKREKGELIPVKISGANKGGLLAEVSGIPAFLPVSQLSPQNYPRVEGGDTSKILKELQKFVGQEIEVKIFDLDPREGKLILSEKAKETEKIKEVLKNYKVGDVVEGEITGLVDFGAFMKFSSEKNAEGKSEDLEGLIHISELDWSIIGDPGEIVKIGEKIKAKIIEIKEDKVSLSLKSLKKDPWSDIEKEYKKGDEVLGKVTKFNPFGAFIQITPVRNALPHSDAGGPKIQGLCHISEFGTKQKMEEELKIGQEYNFQIIEIRPEEHRMSLKLAEK